MSKTATKSKSVTDVAAGAPVPAPAAKTPTAYDAVPYPSAVFPATHPDRLAMIAKLFHLDAPNPTTARVLELGCAHGTNLIPLAVQYPEGEFFGVDLSEVQIAKGKETIAKLGLKNIRLETWNILDLTAARKAEIGKFDFIVTHGIYSWVPAPVRDGILRASKELLTENGVVFISYNVNPGWKMRGMVRDMMLYHTRNFPDAATKVIQSRALVQFLATSVDEKSPYGAFLRSELKQMETWRDDYLFHDSLEEVNEPFYFHEVAAHAKTHGLEYLGDSELHAMFNSNYPPAVQENLKRVSTDIIASEQYADFLRNRLFRQSLFVHQGRNVNRALNPQDVKQFYISARIKPENPALDILSGSTDKFIATGTEKFITTDRPLIKAAFMVLIENWSHNMTFNELFEGALEMLGTTEQKRTGRKSTYTQEQLIQLSDMLAEAILFSITIDLVNLHTTPHSYTLKISEKPVVTPLARLEVKDGTKVTNLRHEQIEVDEFARCLIPLLDGTRDKRLLAQAMTSLIEQNVIGVSKDGMPLHMHPNGAKILNEEIDNYLKQISRAALLLS